MDYPNRDVLYRQFTGPEVKPARVDVPKKTGFRKTTTDEESSRILDEKWGGLAKGLRRWRKFVHKYTELEKGHIRLVVIKEGSPDDPLELDMVSVPFTKSLSYAALSYEWGDSPPVHQVTIRDYSTQLYSTKFTSFSDPRARLAHALKQAIGTR